MAKSDKSKSKDITQEGKNKTKSGKGEMSEDSLKKVTGGVASRRVTATKSGCLCMGASAPTAAATPIDL